MADINFAIEAAPTAPSANTVQLYVDTNDRRLKTIDEYGNISVLNNIGMHPINRIINGGMAIQQRVATSSTAITGISTTTRGGVVADRWSVTSSVASNLAWAQIDSGASPESNLLSRYYGEIISSSAGKKVMISQWLLNVDIMDLLGSKARVAVKYNQKVGSTGQTFKLGLLYLTASGTIDTSPAFLSGAWSTSQGTDPSWGTNLAAITPDSSPLGVNGTITGSYLNCTTAASWKQSSCVFSVPATAKNLVVVFFADATGGTTDNIAITEVQLTKGTDIVDWTPNSWEYEMAQCQRFYTKTFDYPTVPANSTLSGMVHWATGAAAGATSYQGGWRFPVTMWKIPATITFYNPAAANAYARNLSLGTDCSATTAANATQVGLDITCTTPTSTVIGHAMAVNITADAEIVA